MSLSKKKNLAKKKSFGGFTLLEVMAALVLIGCLLIFSPKWETSISKEKDQVHQINAMIVENASLLYKIDVGIYPGKIDDLLVCPPGIKNWHGPYLDKEPVNLWEPVYYKIDEKGRVSW